MCATCLTVRLVYLPTHTQSSLRTLVRRCRRHCLCHTLRSVPAAVEAASQGSDGITQPTCPLNMSSRTISMWRRASNQEPAGVLMLRHILTPRRGRSPRFRGRDLGDARRTFARPTRSEQTPRGPACSESRPCHPPAWRMALTSRARVPSNHVTPRTHFHLLQRLTVNAMACGPRATRSEPESGASASDPGPPLSPARPASGPETQVR